MANPDRPATRRPPLDLPDGGQTGIELELHLDVVHRYQAAVVDVDPAWSAGVW